MISLRCRLIVKSELEVLGLRYAAIDLGMVELLEDVTEAQRNQFVHNLARSGLELLDDKKSILIEKIKNVVVEMFHYAEELPTVNFSEYLSKKLNYDYNYLSNIFSEVMA